MKIIYLESWDDFQKQLSAELHALGHLDPVLVRNFEIETAVIDNNGYQLGMTDRYQLVISTGTDRDNTSPFWNAPGFDHDHDLEPTEKRPEDIIYAYLVDHTKSPLEVIHGDETETFSLTESLDWMSGIIVYKAHLLDKASRNEYWFSSKPVDAALLVFRVREPDEDGEE